MDSERGANPYSCLEETSTKFDLSSFATYAEYLKATPWGRQYETLLYKLESGGPTSVCEACSELEDLQSIVIRVDPVGFSIHQGTDDFPTLAKFRQFLSQDVSHVQFQFVIISKHISGLLPSEIDAIGLELGVSPAFWNIALECGSTTPVLAMESTKFVRFYHSFLVFTNLLDDGKPKTGEH